MSTHGCRCRPRFIRSTLVLAAVLLCRAIPGRGPAHVSAQSPGGISHVTRSAARVTVPTTVPSGEVRRYGLGTPFQAGPRTGGVFCNLRVEGVAIGDFEDGTDAILFDDLSRISADAAVPITRDEKPTDPATGRRRYVVKFSIGAGFVPLGARRADGSPHPHAGTGFSFCADLSFPMLPNGYFSTEDKSEWSVELHQLAYDGRNLRLVRTDKYPVGIPLVTPGSGWRVSDPGLTTAIPDGDGLLAAVVGTRKGTHVSGIARWERRQGMWRPSAFTPVAAPGCPEPSLIRDADGSLLFSARAYKEDQNTIRIWRSGDNGAQWTQRIVAPGVRAQAPIVLNQAADGTPYMAGNPLGHKREVLCIWPLRTDRSGLESGMIIRDAPAEFGLAKVGRGWKLDHPNAMTLRLADGKWHNILAYRIMDAAEHDAAPPPPQSGTYLEEAFSTGPAIPVWNFKD